MATPTLLNIDSNAKTIKGQKQGYMTAILYLAPYKTSGVNVCPMAELAGCIEGCLNTAGRGGMARKGDVIATDGGDLPNNNVQRARIKRTQWFSNDRATFMAALVLEIARFKRKAERKGLIPTVRLNGTSDIQWELIPTGGRKGKTIFDLFPEIQFYDYTKIPKRFNKPLPDNYHLTLSYSGATDRYKSMCANVMETKPSVNIAFVARDQDAKQQLLNKYVGGAIDGDNHDLRFLDPIGTNIILKAKGRARKDTSGFVLGAA